MAREPPGAYVGAIDRGLPIATGNPDGDAAPGRPPETLFLISPAHLGARRAQALLAGRSATPLGRLARTEAGAPIGAVYAQLSGLYFRGKLAYAQIFARPPAGLLGAYVIAPGEGLRHVHERVTLARLREAAEIEVDERNPRFTEPLVADAKALGAAAPEARFVLLGSVATDKYVSPLLAALGDRLLFPIDFVGRGDMSRGALLLQAVRAGRELPYGPVAAAVRRGGRAPRVARGPARR